MILAYRLRFSLLGKGKIYGNFEKREGRDRLDFTVGTRYPNSYFVAAVFGSRLHLSGCRFKRHSAFAFNADTCGSKAADHPPNPY